MKTTLKQSAYEKIVEKKSEMLRSPVESSKAKT